MASLDGNYFLCNYRDHKVTIMSVNSNSSNNVYVCIKKYNENDNDLLFQAIADRIEHIKLPLRDRYQFVNAPVTIRNKHLMQTIEDMTEVYSNNGTLELSEMVELPSVLPDTSDELETTHKKIMLYMWLR